MDLINKLITEKRIPEIGWDKTTIEYLLSYLSSMDANNFINKSSVGEREGRCFSDIVTKRNLYFIHGIGRSGDLTEPQPKATGSSILYKLTNELLRDLMNIYNIKCKCLLVPIPISTSLALCLSSYYLLRPSSKYVIWLRVDNDVIFNAIINRGFTSIIIKPEYGIDILLQKVKEINPDKINCIISTVCCLYPRKADNVCKISEICTKYEIPHIILNDCGLQNKNIMSKIKKAQEGGKVDLVLQNAGENFMVPRGSTLVTSSDVNVIERFAKIYPGRASSSSVIDILVTLLSLGKTGYTQLLHNKELSFQQFQSGLTRIAEKYKSCISSVLSNDSSIALIFCQNIKHLSTIQKYNSPQIKINFINSSGKKVLNNFKFEGWRTHGISCPVPFVSFQLSLGTSPKEIDSLLEKIDIFIGTLQIPK